jgi:hypothetical protein
MTDEYEAMHKELGCDDCQHAETEKVGKGPCCTHARGPSPNTSGNCTRQKRKEENKE